MSHYQGFDIKVLTPLGKWVSFIEITFEFPDLWELKNGKRIFKEGDAMVKAKIKGKFLFVLAGLAIAAGSWQKIKPLSFMNVDVPDSEDEDLPIEISAENVVFHLPKSFNFNKVEGSDDEFEIEGGILGQAFVNGIPVFAHRDEAGL